ncbi:Mucin-associated surface protein (MASP) [Trypanosoma cruzi]|uniref:Mucin-associated surface protein (MASP) n=1 Tax=Trypanosoma cruzi TaxID=5693 RepID=A0A2V2XIH9_TRYCR|nr:Mucin-associated surface protein (MASP) [Trypanosoma cruzi]
MAMMTGRVLLVCALCVLWCGLSGVAAHGEEDAEKKEDGSSGGPGPDADDGSAGLQAMQVPVKGGPEREDHSLGAQTGNSTNEQSVVVMSPPESSLGPEEEEEEEEVETVQKEKLESTTEEEETPKLTSSQEGEGPPAPVTTRKNEKPAETSDATPGKGQSSSGDVSTRPELHKTPSEEQPSSTAPQAPAPAAAAQIKNESTTSADVVSGQQIKEESQHDMQSEGASGKEENVPTTVTKKDGPTESNAESTPTPPSAYKDAITNDDEKSNEEVIPKHDQTPDGETMNEASQVENNEGNTNKTQTVEAAAITNNTATPGDSDSSTAVSHTTSPLLLLLLVVAAAAAVVAA